jgi:hypothetical protein
MIAIGLLFVRICVTASSREGGWKRKSWSCGISSMFYSSPRHIDCMCVGPTATKPPRESHTTAATVPPDRLTRRILKRHLRVRVLPPQPRSRSPRAEIAHDRLAENFAKPRDATSLDELERIVTPRKGNAEIGRLACHQTRMRWSTRYCRARARCFREEQTGPNERPAERKLIVTYLNENIAAKLMDSVLACNHFHRNTRHVVMDPGLRPLRSRPRDDAYNSF